VGHLGGEPPGARILGKAVEPRVLENEDAGRLEPDHRGSRCDLVPQRREDRSELALRLVHQHVVCVST
jgi:hypothetical protein